MLHPSPKQLISFSAGNLRESLSGPQPFQLFFVSRRLAHPAVPPPRGCAKGPQPLRLPSAGGGMYPAEERFFHPSAHKKRMKPHAPSVPETAYLLFSREPPGEFERAAALSTFLRIPATCAPRLPPLSGDARFFHPSAHKKRMKPNAPSVPETAYLLFSREPPGEFERAAALSTFLRIPATCAPGAGYFCVGKSHFPEQK